MVGDAAVSERIRICSSSRAVRFIVSEKCRMSLAQAAIAELGAACHRLGPRCPAVTSTISCCWGYTRALTLMPNTGRPLPIQCPKCGHEGSGLVVGSRTIMMMTCASCRHTWATELHALPADIQLKVVEVVRENSP
jgi:hypothetical protein